jgi:predicted nucleic acid-binding protein
MPGEFLDTNILVYAFSTDARAAIAEQCLARGGAVSIQGLNEFANTARRKLGMSWEEVDAALLAIRSLCSPVLPLTLETHVSGLDVARRYRLSVFDGLMIASALHGDCDTFWSEDLQDGLMVDGRLRISNPFTPDQRT